jgi:hypothetical protein
MRFVLYRNQSQQAVQTAVVRTSQPLLLQISNSFVQTLQTSPAGVSEAIGNLTCAQPREPAASTLTQGTKFRETEGLDSQYAKGAMERTCRAAHSAQCTLTSRGSQPPSGNRRLHSMSIFCLDLLRNS